jgi:MFS family permease
MSSDAKAVSWSEILSREHFSKLATMAMAIWLHAANSNLTATTMPSAVAEIGGLNLLSWTFALYLAGSIASGASASLLVSRYGLRATMIRSALVYGLGCCVCGFAPSMEVVLVGRTLQGLGGGALVALVYISQDRFFPNHFVPRIVAVLSMVWMTSSFIGPTLGGAFATWGLWRYAYFAFAIQSVILVVAIRYLLVDKEALANLDNATIPIVRLAFLGLSIILVSLAGSEFHPFGSPLLVLAGLLCLGLFVRRDKIAAQGRMLPLEATELSHPVCQGIVMTFLLCLAIMSFLVYGPFILIKLYDMTPLGAGFLVMLESIAWGSAAIIFSNVKPHREQTVIRVGSAQVVIGLVGMAFTLPYGPLWLLVVFIIINSGGFGMMWGFIIRRIISAAPLGDKDRTSSTVPITQQAGFAIGAALCGLIANGLGLSDQSSAVEIQQIAFWLFAGFVPIALLGCLMAWRFTRST